MPKSDDAVLDMSKPSIPVSYPIKSLQDLRTRSYLDSFHFEFNRSTVPLRINSDGLPKRPRVLVCHDMKGGYVDDKWIQGCENDAGFAIWHWYLMDIFVYFSHSLVTLPPPCWTNTAHRHGVKVLGTFITEWGEGKAVCKEMLATKESAQMYAERLAELATALGFDGWLINIENGINQEQIPNLMEFVSHLKEVLHLSSPGGLVIWYDSVTVGGKLHWQNQLTELNKPFFDLCDGIFINYTWRESYPKLSAEIAGDRRYDVYMGIDVFGRGSFGGGQWTVNTALDLLKRSNLSAALFAPGWVHETAQPPNFHTAQNKWWSLIEKSWGIVQTYPRVLPFYSDFNQGLGYHVSLEGRQLSDSPWYNISCQSLQPLLDFNDDDNKDVIQVTVDPREASFNGGGNIAFRGKLEGGDAFFTSRLFKPHLQLSSSSPMTLSFSVKSDETSKLGILLSITSPSQETKSILVAPQEPPIRKFDDIFLQFITTSAQTVSQWTVHETNIVMNDHTLTGISAFCYRPENSTERAEYVAMLGHISIKDQSQQNPETLLPASSWVIKARNVELVQSNSGSKILKAKLEWGPKNLKDSVFRRYNVYAENVKSKRSRKVLETPTSKTVFLGVAHVPTYYVAELLVESDVKGVCFVVQPCAEDGSMLKLDVSMNLLVELEGL